MCVHVSNGLGTQMAQCWDGQITVCVYIFGENSGAQTCGHFGAKGNLNLLFSHSGPHSMPAPTAPSCKPVLSFQEKENLLFCLTEV